MKPLIFAAIAALSFPALAGTVAPPAQAPAAPLSVEFTGVSLIAFVQATYKNMLHRDYVVSPDLLASDRKFSASVRSIEAAALPAFLDDLLASQGVKSELRGSVYYLSLRRPGGDDVVPGDAHLSDVPPAGVAKVPEVDAGQAGLGRVKLVDGPVSLVSPEPVVIFRPQNRTVDFMVTVLNAAFARPVARPAGNQVVLSAASDSALERVQSLAGDLDLAPAQVEVSASFVEVLRTGSTSRGLSLVANVLGARFSAVVGSGAGSLSVSSGSFQAVLDALDADGRFRQVSNSRVAGDEAEKLSLIVGDETPTVSSSGRDQQGNAVQNIVYRSSGVLLDVVPRVLGSGRVSLVVDGQISNFQPTVNGVTGSPTLLKRQVKTSVTIGDGDVLIIGGLDDTKSSANTSGLSFLPKSWSGRTSSDSHTDLVLVLSAKVFRP